MTKDMLLDFMTRFRLECHYRLDMVPGDIRELPIFMYKAAQESVIEDMTKEFNLNEEDVNTLKELANTFNKNLEETDHFTNTDDIITEQIKSGEFSK